MPIESLMCGFDRDQLFGPIGELAKLYFTLSCPFYLLLFIILVFELGFISLSISGSAIRSLTELFLCVV
jgi:hypothetical protein